MSKILKDVPPEDLQWAKTVYARLREKYPEASVEEIALLILSGSVQAIALTLLRERERS